MTNRTTKREFLFNFFYTVFKRRLSIVMIFFAFFGIVLLGTYLVTPTFEATTKILVHMNPSQQLILFRDLATPSEVNPRINPANNLIQISTGQSVAEEMVRTFGLDRRLQQRREHPTELRDKIKNGLVSLLKSPITLAQNLGLLQRREPNYLADAIEDFIDNVQDVTLEEDTEIVNLTVYWESAELASEMANTMAQLLIQKTKELTQIEASGAYEFTREQVSMAEKSLREAEDELSRFMEREKIVSLVEEKKAELQRLEAFETEYTWTNASSEEVRRQLAEGQENAVSATIIKNSPTIGDLITSLNSLEIRLASLRQEFTDDHPEVLGLKAQIAENSARLDKELDSVLDGLRARKAALGAEIESLRVEVDALPRKEVELARLQRRVWALEDRAETLRDKLLELEVQKVSQMGEFDIKIIDKAYIPEDASPDRPNWLLNIAAGIMASMVVALGYAFSSEYWNDPVRSPEEVEGSLKVPALGTVPDLGHRKRVLGRKEALMPLLVAGGGKPDTQGEGLFDSRQRALAYRSFSLVVDNILFKRAKNVGGTFLVTSASAGEGKTTVAVSLAHHMACRGNRTLLIDANLRAPGVDAVLKLESDCALAQLLRHEAAVDDALQSSVADNLDAITSGFTDASLFDPLWLRELQPLLPDFQKRYDIVLLDSPSVETYVDSLILSPLVDGVILTVRADRSRREHLLSAKAKIEEAGGTILGVVLNRHHNPIPSLIQRGL